MNATLKILHELRTIHGGFSHQPIREKDLDTILRAAVRAANASARQSYTIVVPGDEQRRDLNWVGAESLLFCVDFTRLIASAHAVGQSFDAASFLPFLTGVIDTTLAVQNAVIAAKSLGIDSLITNGVYRAGNVAKIRTILKLPHQHCFPLLLVCLGYPIADPGRRKGRLEELGIVHRGIYQRLTAGEVTKIVEQYDDPKRNMGLIENWTSLGFDHYLTWFFFQMEQGRRNSRSSQRACAGDTFVRVFPRSRNIGAVRQVGNR